MSGFLANLAGLALGQPPAGAARLSLPPRFSGSSQIDTDTGLEQLEATPARQADRPSSMEPALQAEVQRQMPATPFVEAAPAPANPSRSQSARQPSPPMTRQTDRPTLAERAVPDRHSSAPLRAIERTQAVRSTTETAVSAQPNLSLRTETIFRQVHNGPSSQPQAAPLSQAVLANRAVVEREQQPVVNVTIDRIEVRAPRETPQAQAPRRAKPQPSLSLADYLGARR